MICPFGRSESLVGDCDDGGSSDCGGTSVGGGSSSLFCGFCGGFGRKERESPANMLFMVSVFVGFDERLVIGFARSC